MNIKTIAAVIAATSALMACSSPADLPTTSASYVELQNEVGCQSTHGEDKQKHLWETLYKDHWMTWSGVVESVPAGGVTIDVDGVGASDLAVQFENEKDAFELGPGDQVQVKFVMKEEGGCMLDFEGEHAQLVSVIMKSS